MATFIPAIVGAISTVASVASAVAPVISAISAISTIGQSFGLFGGGKEEFSSPALQQISSPTVDLASVISPDEIETPETEAAADAVSQSTEDLTATADAQRAEQRRRALFNRRAFGQSGSLLTEGLTNI